MRILLLTAAVALASASPARMSPQTTASVIAVTIDAAVMDAGGRPLPGLGAADFSVELDGQSRRVVAVTYFPSGAPMAGAIGPAFDAVTTAPPVYRLVVQPPDDTAAGRGFTVSVTVRRAGARVQAPAQAAAALVSLTGTRSSGAATAPKSTEERLRDAVATGRSEGGIPLQIARALTRGSHPSKLSLQVRIAIAGSVKPPLTALFGLTAGGTLNTATPQIETAPDGTYRVDVPLLLDPGPYKVRFAVVDATGAVGAIESAVNVQLQAVGPLLASDLVRWTMDASDRRTPMLDEIPASASTIRVTLELYPAAGAAAPHDLLVKMELAESGPSASTLIERIVTPEAVGGALVADADFPVERVVKGSYLLRATVMSGATRLGTVSAPVIRR